MEFFMETDGKDPIPSKEAVRAAWVLYDDIRKCFPPAVADFESRWSSWHALCESKASFDGDGSIDPCVESAEHAAIKRLGPKIVPMLVHKLAIDSNQNSHGVFLYKALENDPLYQVAMEEPIGSRDDLRRYADGIVQINYERHNIYETRVGAWHTHCQENTNMSNYRIFTECDEFDDLLDMGTSILTRLMVEYYNNQGGWWWELMHEIIHGRKTYALEFRKPVLYEACEKWFNEGEYDQAPEYILSDLERHVYGPSGPKVYPRYHREDRR
ncbi:hypothetical protein S40288_11420 [Stachybotrys chartarum IBT 40288]|nr:hypothetical protein S40288_11420 [Stachybotrys chartarum IBT 40288]